jgi:MFS family permease
VTRYYGWRVAWTLAVTQIVGYGLLVYAFTVFIAPMEAEFGWSRAQTTGPLSLMLLLNGLMALPIGRLVDRHGGRWIMTGGSAAAALLLLAWSSIDGLFGLYLVQAGIGLASAAVLYEVAFTVIAVWFRRRRRTAMVLVTVVGGLASTLFVPLATALIEGFGWRTALRLMALLMALTAVPLHALVLRRRPADLGLDADGERAHEADEEPSVSQRDAIRGAPFWWLTLAFALNRVVVVAVAAHSVPLLLERGSSPALVAAAVGAIGLMQVAGRLLFAPGSANVPLPLLAAGAFSLHGVALLALLMLPGAVGLWLFAGLFGAATGASTLARAALVAETYGAANFGGINGAIASTIALVQTVAPVGAGLLHDRSGGYDPVLWGLVGVAAVGAWAVGRVRAPTAAPRNL